MRSLVIVDEHFGGFFEVRGPFFVLLMLTTTMEYLVRPPYVQQ